MIRRQLRNKCSPVLALLLLFSVCAQAQSSARYTLSAIHFNGLDRYNAGQVITASGLHIGESVGVGDLQSAAERLSQSGAFDTVSFQSSTRGNDLTAQFGVTETRDVLHCIFDNFVWFSEEELDRVLRQHVAFYTGEAPVRGNSVQEIRGALEELLRAKGISSDVSEMPYGVSGSVIALLFRVDGVSQPIKTIAFVGQSAVSAKQLSDASATLMNQDFSFTNVATYAKASLIPLYYQRGYLRSQFSRPSVSLLDPNSRGSLAEVAITLAVTEGYQYSWNGASWSGNHAVSTDELVKALDMNQQEIANQEKIDVGFATARKLYLSRGYISVEMIPTRELNDTKKLDSYSVQVNEGAQFHMGQVYFDGVSDRVAAALLKKWKLKPGDIYDATYPSDFLQNTAGRELAQQGSSFRTTTMKQEADKNASIVNLHIQFR